MEDRYLVLAWYVQTKNYHVFHNFNFGHTLKDAKAIIGEIKKDTRYTNVTLCKIEKDNHA